MKNGIELIREERERQVAKGYTPSHDDLHDTGEIANAAYCILFEHTQGPGCLEEEDEPENWVQALALEMRKADPIRRMQVAGALIAAEIERLQRRTDTERV
jgi:hypothetical protein